MYRLYKFRKDTSLEYPAEYQNKLYKIESYLEEDESRQHVFLSCATDPTFEIKYCVHLYDLQPINRMHSNKVTDN